MPYGIEKGSLVYLEKNPTDARDKDRVGIVIDIDRFTDGVDICIQWTDGQRQWCLSEAVKLLS